MRAMCSVSIVQANLAHVGNPEQHSRRLIQQMTALPIDDVIPDVRAALRHAGRVVLAAPPGAGKTTRVPLALLDEPWLAGGRILMLEPRRLAARAAAARMAATLGERVGGTVGYRMRMDTNVTNATRIEVVTEGVLTRMIQSDPSLAGAGLVIFDEFHERSVHADLGLALALEARNALRDDLRLMVMSATLDHEPIARLLGNAPVVVSQGRMHPVETRYVTPDATRRIEQNVAATVARSLATDEGDLLVFLPGAAEIRRTLALLADASLPPGVDVLPLHGTLSQQEQDRAVAPSVPGRRKVVLATSIAETSLTIDGVRVVVDSGVMRVPAFSPRSGMTRLQTVRVTTASADQRRGRAGRQAPGIAYRLWNRADDATLLAFNAPEILAADLAPLALELAEWGVPDPAALAWLDVPPRAAYAQARELLAELGALDRAGAITEHGRAMAALPLHPRLAHMVLMARDRGLGATACVVAALLSERDIVRAGGTPVDADIRLRVGLFARENANGRTASGASVDIAAHGMVVDRGAVARVAAQAAQWRRQLGVAHQALDVEASGLLIAMAYPDRVAQLRAGGGGRFVLRNGGAAMLAQAQPMASEGYLAVAELDGKRRESQIFLAAPIRREDIRELLGEQIEQRVVVAWDADTGAVRARRLEMLGALVLRETVASDVPNEAMVDALIAAVRSEGLALLGFGRDARRLQERVAFLRARDASWPDMSDDALLENLEGWLAPHLAGRRRREELASLDMVSVLLASLAWEQRTALERLAPTHITVPSGSRIAIDYSNPESPMLAVRLQEMFGLAETPCVGGGVPLTIQLLSPAQRPVQVTRDLAGFWRNTYFDVRKDLKGRYPKHYWPDDPMQAEPTRRARPRT